HVVVVGRRLARQAETVRRYQEGRARGGGSEVGRRTARGGEELLDITRDHPEACGSDGAVGAANDSVTARARSTSDQSAPGRWAPSLSTWRNARPPRSPANSPSRCRVMCLRNTPLASCAST